MPGTAGAVQDARALDLTDAFPATPSGKIRKSKLRESFIERQPG